MDSTRFARSPSWAAALMFMVVQAAHASSLPSVAKRLTKGLDRLETKRIAVLSFAYHNGDLSSGSSLVTERLTTLLVEKGRAQVVERALLDQALGEIQLGMTGVLDPATTQKLGKVLGVNAIVTGTLIDLEDGDTEVNARLIQTETGSILAAAAGRVKRTWIDLPKPAPVKRMPGEPQSSLHMSKLIPSARTDRPMSTYPVHAPAGANRPVPASSDEDAADVLTLGTDDLVPLNLQGQTDPDRIVDHFLTGSGRPQAQDIRMARRIYHRNPNPQVRGRALLAMGRLLERSGEPRRAVHAYEQILREFPDASDLQTEAQGRLSRLK